MGGLPLKIEELGIGQNYYYLRSMQIFLIVSLEIAMTGRLEI